jgi:hypothetical protein
MYHDTWTNETNAYTFHKLRRKCGQTNVTKGKQGFLGMGMKSIMKHLIQDDYNAKM